MRSLDGVFISQIVCTLVYACVCVVMPASRFLGNEEDGDESEDGNDEGGAVEVTNVEMEFSIRSYIER